MHAGGCAADDKKPVHRLRPPYVSDGDALAFKDKGHGDDFATMWDIILSLLHSEWFMDCAASCVWKDENGVKDVLSQVRETRGSVRQWPVGSGGLGPLIPITLPPGESRANGGAVLTAGDGEGASIAF